jgi:circadian clock protein KaiB
VALMQRFQAASEHAMKQLTQYKFRLYVAGESMNSALARANLSKFCESYLAGRHEIEIVDVFCEPGRALQDSIFLTPTLLKLAPSPVRKIVGTLSQTATVAQVLGLGDVVP